jgi:hypothetical protein
MSVVLGQILPVAGYLVLFTDHNCFGCYRIQRLKSIDIAAISTHLCSNYVSNGSNPAVISIGLKLTDIHGPMSWELMMFYSLFWSQG